MHVLVTAIGSFSVGAVISSLRADERFTKVYGCDIYPKEWHYISKDFDQVYKAPYVSDENEYLEFIKNIVSEKNIDIIIPSTDIEVDFFNKYRDCFQDIVVTIGSSDFLSIARDKGVLSAFLLSEGLNVPKTYSAEELDSAGFPLIGKPKNGRSSEGIFRLQSIEDIDVNKGYKNYIFQELLDGDVITVDILHDKENGVTVSVPRKELIRTTNGAGLTVEMFYDEKLRDLVEVVCQKTGASGAFNMEFIQCKDEYYLIDINPRFSAGIGFTQRLGYDYVKNTMNYYLQQPITTELEYKHCILQKHMVEVLNTELVK